MEKCWQAEHLFAFSRCTDKDNEVVGIDVDHYKKGRQSLSVAGDQLAKLEETLGEAYLILGLLLLEPTVLAAFVIFVPQED